MAETLFTDILTSLRPGYKNGGGTTPFSELIKRSDFLVKNPDVAAKMTETKRAKFRATPVGQRLQWIADNGKNYETPEKFIKAYEKHFKHKLGSEKDALFHFSPKDKASSRYKKNKSKMVALGSIDGLQNTGKTGVEGGDTFTFKKGFSEDEIFKASIIQNNPKVQKQFKNLFKNIVDNVSEYQELGPQGIVKRLEKDGGNLLNDFDFLKSYDPSPGAKQTYGGVHSGVTRRSLINLGIPDKQIVAFQSVRQPVLSLKNILTNLKNYPKSFGPGYGISATTAKKLTGQLDNFMKGYGEVDNIVKQINTDLGDKKFNKIFGGVNFEHTLAKSFGRDYKYLPRNYLLKGQFTTQKFNLLKREVFDLPLIRLMKQYEAGKIPAEKVQAFINDFNAKTNNYADFSFDTEKGKLAYTDNKVKYDLSRYNNPGVAKQELIKNIELTMSDKFQKGFKGTVGAKEQLKLFKSKDATEILKKMGIKPTDIKNVKNFAEKKGFVLNNFAGALDLSKANINIPPSVRKSLTKIVRAGKVLGAGAVVLDPMFAAMDFSKAMGEGLSGKESASYTGQKFFQDIANLPRTLEDLAYVATDKGTFKNFGEKENRLFSYEPAAFADRYIQEKIEATPEATKDLRKAKIDYAKTLPIIDDMDIPMSQSDAQERERAFYIQRGVEPPEEETDFTYDGIMGIIPPKGVI